MQTAHKEIDNNKQSGFDPQHIFPCIEKLNAACGVTLLALTFGLAAGVLFFVQQFTLGVTCILLAGACDFFDGRVARKLNQSSSFGEVMDSLCDTVSFVMVPAFALMQAGDFKPLWCIASGIYVVCGILRLAYFSEVHSSVYFVGIPSPVGCLLVLSLYLLLVPICQLPHEGLIATLYPIYTIIVGLCMLINVRVKKTGLVDTIASVFACSCALIGLIRMIF